MGMVNADVVNKPDGAGGFDFRPGFASCEREAPSPMPLAVEGALPAELRGTLYRIGPARHDVFGDRMRHWWDADGMVHAVTLDGAGGATYRARFVAQPAHQEEDAARRRLFGSFGTAPPGNPLRRFLRRNLRRNPANTSVVMHHGALYALCEAGRPFRLDPITLETRGDEDLGGLLVDNHQVFTAHPRRDPENGDLIGFGVEYGRTAILHVYRWPAAAPPVEIAAIPMLLPALVHDFAITPRHLVFVLPSWALPVGPPVMMLLGQRSFGQSLRWQPARGAYACVVDRATGEARWTRLDPLLCFHLANAFDDGDDVVVDLSTYADDAVLAVFEEVMRGPVETPAFGYLERLRLRPDGTTHRARLSDAAIEFPMIHPHRTAQPHRAIFALSWDDPRDIPRRPVALDVTTGELRRAPHDTAVWAGELVPVPKAGGADERDCWLLSLVLDARRGRCEVRVLDGAAIDAEPRAKVILPWNVPFGFHGCWEGAD